MPLEFCAQTPLGSLRSSPQSPRLSTVGALQVYAAGTQGHACSGIREPRELLEVSALGCSSGGSSKMHLVVACFV